MIKDRATFFFWAWIWSFILWEIALVVLFSMGMAKNFGMLLNPHFTRLPLSLFFYPALFLFAFLIVVKPLVHLFDWFGSEPKERCVLCNKKTEYTRDTFIQFRRGYVEGAGQLCSRCFEKGGFDADN